MQRVNERLVGSDMELMPAFVMYNAISDDSWQAWSELLGNLPPKGERLDLHDGYWAHRDGLAAEYGFAPTPSLDEFMHRIREGKARTQTAVGYDLHAMDSFDVTSLVGQRWATRLLDIGCMPDFTVLPNGTTVRRSVPPSVRSATVRECGGHIHISLPPPFLDSPELTAQFITELDDVVYPMVMDGVNVGQGSWYRRRRVFRPTPYGVEYRSLGASALLATNAESYLSLVFDMVASVWEV